MQEEPPPIKDFLFDYLKKSEKNIQELISHAKFSDIIENVLEDCFDKVISLGEREESLGILATVLLHYLLTNTLVSSQRKIECDGIQIDIIIPNLKTLEIDPKKTLIICIPKTIDKNTIEQKLNQLQKIQPIKENIWLVITKELDFQNKTYVIEKKNETFSKIIYDIVEFENIHGESKFKILRI
ncbi:MAG: hypothetical protein JHC41_05880 [Nitrosopumilus sp.]|jgi:hypothetical protein|nr:hypothetical protein [Nitrosopumilus sp.]